MILSLVAMVMGLIILMSVPTIINVQANSNQSMATTTTTCGMRLLNEKPSHQQFTKHQCFYFNSCLNSGNSVMECYDAARRINCDIHSDRYDCPSVLTYKQRYLRELLIFTTCVLVAF
jgi:hypothetical protein